MLPLGLLAHAHSSAGELNMFGQRPGAVLYVTATLLPLIAFLIILLKSGVKSAVRRYRGSGAGKFIWELLGGDQQSGISAWIATGAIGLACLLSILGFALHLADHGDHPDWWQDRLEFIRLDLGDGRGATSIELGYKVDNLTSAMFLMVTFVATLIHVFSMGYMKEELQETVEDHQVHTAHGHLHRRGRHGRFFMFLSLFCFSMLNLILADNLFQVFISWELVGICSYLLIGFYYERQSASNAANKAFITNRIGDAGFIVGLLIVWTYIGTFNFEDIFTRVRAPLRDHEGSEVEMAGQFVRVSEVGRDSFGKIVQIDPSGASVLLMGHIHANQLQPFVRDDKGRLVIKDGQPVPTTIRRVKDRPETIGESKEGMPPAILEDADLSTIPYTMLVLGGLGLFLGCVGKSAQFPLQVWLPDAMEGPTPVSALIHAATMVAAGVYLVARVFPVFTPEVKLVIAYTGAITLFIAATIAVVMTDIKKVLAYSTVSQLGYMMLALGVGHWVGGLFHLLTHAFFKALLFLGSGSVIHGCHHEQDMSKMGGLLKKMPITAWTMLVGVLSIAGTPLFAGWYSKDAILAGAFGFSHENPTHLLLFLLPLLTAGLTTFYMFRMWFLTFTGEPRDEHVHDHAHESPLVMTVPLILLAIASVCVAWGWPIWDPTASALEHHLHHVIENDTIRGTGAGYASIIADYGRVADYEHGHLDYWPHSDPELHPTDQGVRSRTHELHDLAGLLALFSAGLGFVFATLIYPLRRLDPAEALEQFPGVYAFLANKWAFDDLYSVLIVRPGLVVAGWSRWFDTKVIDGIIDSIGMFTIRLAKWDGKFDNGVIDGIANLVADVTYAVGSGLRRVQTGYIRSYVLFLVLAAIGLFALLRWLAV